VHQECWNFLFGSAPGQQQLNSTQVWDLVREARKTFRDRKRASDLGQTVVNHIWKHTPVTFEKAETFLLPAEAGFVSPVRDNSTAGADRAYKACRSGSAWARG
jgi:hypothetical protein